MIQFERETWSDRGCCSSREWLETNGLGGFASSTIIGLNTRRYHGLLVAATKPPVGRLVLLSKLEETLLIDGRRFDLSANRYPGVIHPQGFHYLKQFRLDPFPVFTYDVEGIEMEKSVFMIHGENSAVIHYELRKNNSSGGTEEPAAGNSSVDCIPRLPRHDSRKRRHQPSGARTLWIGNCHSLSTVA
jgi:glycogen debranching enzyme